MHGPAFDGSGRIVNRMVPTCDVIAYQRAGYQKGTIVEEPATTDVKTSEVEAVKPAQVKKKGK